MVNDNRVCDDGQKSVRPMQSVQTRKNDEKKTEWREEKKKKRKQF